MNKPEILDQLAESRQEFLNALQGLSYSQLTQEPVEGSWTIKDLLAHLASWENACLLPLRAFAGGGEFVPEVIPDHLAWNKIQADQWQSLTLDETLSEYDRVRGEIVALLAALPDGKWAASLPAPWGGNATLAELCDGLAWHEKVEHLKSIHQWKQTGKPR